MNAPTPEPDAKIYKDMSNVYSISIKVEHNCIVIVILKEEDIPKKRFEAKFSLEQLVKISKMFLPYESIEEMAVDLNGILQDNKYKLQEEQDKVLFTMTLLFNKRKYDITIEVPYISNQQGDILLDICNTINQIKKTLVTMDERIIKLETNSNNKEKQLRISLLDQGFQHVIAYNIFNRAIQFELIYKATRDGDSAQSFHSHCDNKAGTLVVIKTTKDIVFGGYTSVTWNSIDDYKKDLKAFLFSNTLKKIYPFKDKDSYSIKAQKNYGPTFGGGHDIYVSDKCLNSNANYVKTYSYENSIGDELNNDEHNFIVKELKVYAIIFCNVQ